MPQSQPPNNTPFIVPQFLIFGEIWNWLTSLTEFTPQNGFSLKYFFNLLNDVNFQGVRCSFEVDASINGNNFWFYKDSGNISPVQGGSLVPGEYQWYSQVAGLSNGTSIKQRAQWGQLTIFPDQTAGVDVRTLERIILDSLNAMIAKTATLEQQEYTIGDRHIGKMDRVELLKYRDRYKTICVAQAAKMSFDSGNLKSTNDIRLYMAPKHNGPANLNPISPWQSPE